MHVQTQWTTYLYTGGPDTMNYISVNTPLNSQWSNTKSLNKTARNWWDVCALVIKIGARWRSDCGWRVHTRRGYRQTRRDEGRISQARQRRTDDACIIKENRDKKAHQNSTRILLQNEQGVKDRGRSAYENSTTYIVQQGDKDSAGGRGTELAIAEARQMSRWRSREGERIFARGWGRVRL